MRRTFLQAKVHRALVTEADLEYEGSLTLDENLMDAAGMLPFQRIEVYDVTNGNRFATYLIPGPRGQGDCCINGAAAHKARPGDRVIIATYCDLEEHEVKTHRPQIVLISGKDDNTRFTVKSGEVHGARVPA